VDTPAGALDALELSLKMLDDALDTLTSKIAEEIVEVRVRTAEVRDELERLSEPEVEVDDDGS
jgi:hypothetical protein